MMTFLVLQVFFQVKKGVEKNCKKLSLKVLNYRFQNKCSSGTCMVSWKLFFFFQTIKKNTINIDCAYVIIVR